MFNEWLKTIGVSLTERLRICGSHFIKDVIYDTCTSGVESSIIPCVVLKLINIFNISCIANIKLVFRWMLVIIYWYACVNFNWLITN